MNAAVSTDQLERLIVLKEEEFREAKRNRLRHYTPNALYPVRDEREWLQDKALWDKRVNALAQELYDLECRLDALYESAPRLQEAG